MDTDADSKAAVIFIEGELTIYRAHELKQLLLRRLVPDGVVEVDLGGVTEMDSAGLQLLLLAKRTARLERCELRLVAHSPAVLALFELLNLGPLFGDPLVMWNN
jgi:anti-sigma B factor antagonist